MAAINYPATLPDLLHLGFTYRPRRNYIAHPTDEGPELRRRKGTAALWDLDGTVLLNDAQVATLQAFFDGTLGSGVEWFNFPDPFTRLNVDMRFREEPTIVAATPRGSTVAYALEVVRV